MNRQLVNNKPIDVMVLGTYHFANPGRDLHNLKVDNVLTDRRQAELDSVAKAILAFKPTQVMVEMQGESPSFEVPSFKSFNTTTLLSDSNEIVQLGFRIARMAHLLTVNGIDVQPKTDEEDYFPYDKVKKSAGIFGQNNILQKMNDSLSGWTKLFEAKQAKSTIPNLLSFVNSPETREIFHHPYYDMLKIGDGNTQAGAELNARWYLRNAKIFGKVIHLAKPGNRILIVYGMGHIYWLRHFASETTGYRFVDPLPYLARANNAS
jgi:hypothetical protein